MSGEAQPLTVSGEAQAWLRLEQLRWDGAAESCPHCGERGACAFLPTRTGRPRSTTSGAPTARRVWRCAACRQQFTVLTGTLLAGTRVPLTVWLAVAEVMSCPPSARALARTYAITPETARGVLARLTTVPGRSGPALLRELLRLPADEVARARAALPGRRRGPRSGPSADYR